MIIKLKGETHWLLDDFSSWFLMMAQQEVLSKTNILLSELDVKQRLDFLNLRYTTFKEFVGYNCTSLDMQAELMRATDEIWDKILKQSPFVADNYHREDPHFSKLSCLYGMGYVKKEGEVDVIVLLDCIEKISSDEPRCYEVSEFEAEVNSPAIFPTQTI